MYHFFHKKQRQQQFVLSYDFLSMFNLQTQISLLSLFSLLQRAILPLPSKSSFVGDKDTIYLEDEYGRVKLVGSTFSVHSFVTGL